jgi:energy-coupling factor transporter ATP-binding protein EcfA2
MPDSNYTKGSEWHKWDLHIHTPYTKLNNGYTAKIDEDIWKTFCTILEQSDVAAFGITDYFSFENYLKLLERHLCHFPNSKKVFFPNIELRLDVSVNKAAEEVNIHIIFSNTISPLKLDEFLQKLNTNITTTWGAGISCKSLKTEDDFMKACVSSSNIKSVLEGTFGSENCYLVFAAANNTGLRPDTKSPRKINISDELDKLCHGFFGGPQNVEYFLKTDRYVDGERSRPKPVLCGCDAHSFNELSDYLGKKATRTNPTTGEIEVTRNPTWIKSELTFEGLRQILFEPSYRVSISEQSPREPVRRLDYIKFNFPADTTIKKADLAHSQDLCIKNLKTEIKFSPYFTSIIGGRGTGKSTIINILAEKLGIRTTFLDSRTNAILVEGKELDIEKDSRGYIDVSGTEEVEFISQGRVEELAEGDQLTKLIFNERIKELELKYQELNTSMGDQIEALNQNVNLLLDLKINSNRLNEQEKEKNTAQKIIDSEKDPRYIEITAEINDTSLEIAALESSRKKYHHLLSKLSNLIAEIKKSDIQNEFETRISQILASIQGFDEFKNASDSGNAVPLSFDASHARLSNLVSKQEITYKRLNDFFQEKGTSEESIKDSQNATERIARLTKSIEDIGIKVSNAERRVAENQKLSEEIVATYSKTDELIKNSIQQINSRLRSSNENIQEIRFEHHFNQDSFKRTLFEEFHLVFDSHFQPNTQIDKVQEVLYLVEPNRNLLTLNYSDYLQKLNDLISGAYNRGTLYVSIVINIFSDETNFTIYKTLLQKHLFNLGNHISIKGFYGNRELSSCSFGQRCAAVIVTLLMTGVKPLIIDEPEAHLDNRLIADYLVLLIKEKKLDRQIIFATHNANFVLNGDSELIHILEMPDSSNFTNVLSTTIENLEQRNKLLKLEGGWEAFLSRESKYGEQP